MSNEATNWAYDLAPTLLTDKGKPDSAAHAVLNCRANRADAIGGNTYAGTADVARQTRLDERTVERADRRLEAAGYMVRDGFGPNGTIRWRLNLAKVAETENRELAAEAIRKRKAADAVRQQRRRLHLAGDHTKCDPKRCDAYTATSGDIESDVATKIAVTDAESVTSRTQNPDVTDAESGCHGRSAPRIVLEPPAEPSVLTIPGGTLPPDPLRPVTASPQRNDEDHLLSEPLTPAQDEEGDSLPRTGASARREGVDGQHESIRSGQCQGGHPAMPAGRTAAGALRCPLCRAAERGVRLDVELAPAA